MKNSFKILLASLVLAFFISCDQEETVTDVTQFPRIKVENLSVSEGAELAQVKVLLTWPFEQEVTVDYILIPIENGAEEDLDYVASSGTVVFSSGTTEQIIEVELINDIITESDEVFEIELSKPVYGEILTSKARITILNDDTELVIDDTGYVAPEEYQGYERVWEEDFLGNSIDQSIWTHEIGGGGWGNNELQYYTDRPDNSFQGAGYLFIEGKEESLGGRDYTSARMISQDKFEFKYGRVDIRAKLPGGKGFWPALWMLGANFQDVGWPRCGEIDIMEMIGSQTQIVHGTAHYFSANNAPDFKGKSTFLPGGVSFTEEFHVFSIIWREDYIEWRVDDKAFHTLVPADLDGADWPYNQEFFFIMNVAIGGNWPGSPDATTTFPQRMIVDYIRLYQ